MPLAIIRHILHTLPYILSHAIITYYYYVTIFLHILCHYSLSFSHIIKGFFIFGFSDITSLLPLIIFSLIKYWLLLLAISLLLLICHYCPISLLLLHCHFHYYYFHATLAITINIFLSSFCFSLILDAIIGFSLLLIFSLSVLLRFSVIAFHYFHYYY
jgi:hypothetical protein